MQVLYFLAPILLVGLIVFFVDRHHPEYADAKPGRLPLMLLLVLLLSGAGVFGYYLGGFAVSSVINGTLGDIVTLACMALAVYILLLIVRALAKLLKQTRQNRSIALTAMTLLLAAESYYAYVQISGQLI